MEQSDFDRKIEVITGILADLTVKQQVSEEHMKDWDERMDRAERRMTRVENVLKLAIRAGRRERREWREKYAALVDAQMRSEAKLERTEESVARLSEAQARTEAAQARMSEAQALTEQAMKRLAEAQASSDRTFEAFIKTVRQDVEHRRARPSVEAKDEGADGEIGKSGES